LTIGLQEEDVSFQAYLDNIRAKTGTPPEDIAAAVRSQGLSKPGEMVAWLKTEYGLGHGHAMAIVALARRTDQPSRSDDDPELMDWLKQACVGA
jgi:hypothetical protein